MFTEIMAVTCSNGFFTEIMVVTGVKDVYRNNGCYLQ
jgi:hypothetical protein